jgi:hypothetical protein
MEYKLYVKILKAVIETANLTDKKQSNRFVQFMIKRFPNESDINYLFEWASRFKNKAEWYSADFKSKTNLLDIDYEHYSKYFFSEHKL